EHVAGSTAQALANRCHSHRPPRIRILTRNHADGCNSDGTGSPAPQTAPHKLARQREFIEPLAAVVAHAPRQDAAFPRPDRGLKSRQLRQHVSNPARAFQVILFIDMLPAGEKPPELARGDRLNFATEAV